MAVNTYVDWSDVLKDRIGKMSPDGLVNMSHYDRIIDKRNRSLGNQSGSKAAGISLRPTSTAGGSAGSSAANSAANQQNQRTPDNSAGSIPAPSGSSDVISSGTDAQSSGGADIASAPSAWQWGQGVDGLPFDYQGGQMGAFKDIAEMNVANVSGDPAMQRRLWSQFMGGDETTQQMLGNYVDPETMSRLFGMGKLSPVDQLKFMDAFSNYSTSAVGDGSNSMNARDIMGRMVAGGMARDSDDPTSAPTNNSLGETLGANATADVQIQNFLNMMDQSVQFLMNDRTYAAYKSTIEREAQRFLDYRMTSQGANDGMTFAQWINTRLGPNAGL